jgi:hypothetical protein
MRIEFDGEEQRVPSTSYIQAQKETYYGVPNSLR